MGTPFFQVLQSKISKSSLTLPSHTQLTQPSQDPIGSTFKIYPESNPFSAPLPSPARSPQPHAPCNVAALLQYPSNSSPCSGPYLYHFAGSAPHNNRNDPLKIMLEGVLGRGRKGQLSFEIYPESPHEFGI